MEKCREKLDMERCRRTAANLIERKLGTMYTSSDEYVGLVATVDAMEALDIYRQRDLDILREQLTEARERNQFKTNLIAELVERDKRIAELEAKCFANASEIDRLTERCRRLRDRASQVIQAFDESKIGAAVGYLRSEANR